ncbi:alpha-mannosidase [Vallitalea guaymasensis]|uniref:alpha-mannosidase n=1 Tax=Vallitalea guaymasensis TaxID=1185412 RepID=UPI00235330DD|nr:alpha-mannosidase [Vallitalea guaymasensis]
MDITLERLKKITKELKKYIYSKRINIDKYLVKKGNYKNIEEVEKAETKWQEFNRGDFWGGIDSHFWFRTKVEIPEDFAGRKVGLCFYTGEPKPLSVDNDGWDVYNPQFILYVDKMLIQGLDINHREVSITDKAHAGQEYQIDLHAYSSGKEKITSELFGELVVIDESVRKLYYNIQVPIWVTENLQQDDKRRIDILTVLNQTINLIDLRKPLSDLFFKSINQANQFIEQELYNKMCGHEDVIATCVGHTHIDVAWLWTLKQTREKVTRSFSTVLKLMEEYPEYTFMSSQPQLYKYIKEDHPEIYRKIKKRIEEGRWEPEGSMWLEADCNISSGESLIRQIMFGKRFFKEEFDVENEILWLPDVFGYSAALPQILKRSEIQYFTTTKINWNQFNKLPNDTFMWRGIDGSEVMTYFISTRNPYYDPETYYTTYNGFIHPGAIMGGWDRYQQKNINNDILVAFGFGDGGGGATIEMLETGRRMNKGIPGCPKVEIGKAGDYFKGLDEKFHEGELLPKWVGELYLEYHRGTYTSMAKNKWYNRKSELLYQDIEFLYSLSMNFGNKYPQQKIHENWETILLNQFHDILPGTSIREVYEDSHRQYETVLKEGNILAEEGMKKISENIKLENTSIVVYNTLSYDRSDIAVFDMPEGYENPCIEDEMGNIIPCQIIEGIDKPKAVFFSEKIPSKGYKAFNIRNDHEKNNHIDKLTVKASKLSNKYFSIAIDGKGTITSIYDKLNNREILRQGKRGNQLQVFEDKPMKYDNWDIDIYYKEKMWEIDEVTKVEIVEEGPVRGGLKIHKKFLDSTIIQTIYIYSNIPRIDFDTYIDWKENQLLLKTAFPVDIQGDKATYDIQFGNVERVTHNNTSWDAAQFEVCAHKWADLSEDAYGISLLNDCKYGYDIKDSDMRLTLLKSGIEPQEADQGEHRFVYSLYPHVGNWKYGNTVQMAYNLNTPLYTRLEQAHEGFLPRELSMIQVDQENVIIETIKKAEDSDDIIIRLYECYNRRCEVTIKFFSELNEVIECNMMEKELENIPVDNMSFHFQIKPYEIRTFKVKLKNDGK